MPVSPASPPKRMTRARAKAAEEKLRTTVVKTPAARAASAAKSTKRKGQSDNEEVEKLTESSQQSTRATKKTISSSAKVTRAPSTSTSKPAAISTSASDTRPQTRARKPAVRADADPSLGKGMVKRAVASTTASRSRRVAGTAKSTNAEKENQLPPHATEKKSILKNTSATTISKKSIKSAKAVQPVGEAILEEQDEEAVRLPSEPLSPKKFVQLAAPCPGRADQTSTLQRSPLRPSSRENEVIGQSPRREVQSPSRMDSVTGHDFLSMSPARRPPPSPFKDAMKSSPHKNIISTTSISFGDSMITIQTPKRFNIAEQKARSAVHTSTTNGPFIAPMLQSPARRPPSPIKDLGFLTSRKPTNGPLEFNTSALKAKPRKFQLSPIRQSSSPSKSKVTSGEAASARSPVQSVQADVFNDELDGSHISNVSATDDTTKELFPGTQHLDKAMNLDIVPEPVQTHEHGLEQESSSDTASSGMVDPFCVHMDGLITSEQQVLEFGSPDELQSSDAYYATTPKVARMKTGQSHLQTPSVSSQATTRNDSKSAAGAMTQLAHKLARWQRSPSKALDDLTPSRSSNAQTPRAEDVDNFEDDTVFATLSEGPLLNVCTESAPIEIAADENASFEPIIDTIVQPSKPSDAVQTYGDENVQPEDEKMVMETFVAATPTRLIRERPQVMHTVSKVPLKPSAEFAVAEKSRNGGKRSRSMSGALTPMADLELQAFRQIYPQGKSNEAAFDNASTLTSENSSAWSCAATPSLTVRSPADSKLLNGAVVFVDVHTSEGADASGIFVDLLTQMGAKCVKEWRWKSRLSSTVNSMDDLVSNSKVGITHVVFKDGGKRTMEKIREARGLVSCVGVAWVLDCERENQWLDEIDYAIDTSIVPRGGHKRRKSMEPKALQGSWGSQGSSSAYPSPTKEFLDFDNTQIGEEQRQAKRPKVSFAPAAFLAESPSRSLESGEAEISKEVTETPLRRTQPDPAAVSPATPYFLHTDELVQQTCPPKQTQELFFPVSGRIRDQPDARMRQRLQEARRKTLQFVPKVGSPLSK